MAQISTEDLEQATIKFSSEFKELKDRVKIKDNEIEKLKTEISNLKILAAKENSKRKTKKK